MSIVLNFIITSTKKESLSYRIKREREAFVVDLAMLSPKCVVRDEYIKTAIKEDFYWHSRFFYFHLSLRNSLHMALFAKWFQLMLMVSAALACAPSNIRRRSSSAMNDDPEPMLVGGWSRVDVNDPAVQTMAAFATKSLVQRKHLEASFNLLSVSSAERQVVSGVNYKLRLTLKSGSGGKDQHCEVIVYDQPWTNTRELTHFKCHPKESN